MEFPTAKPKKKGKKRKNEDDSPELIKPKSRKKRSSKVESKEEFEVDEEGATGGEKENKNKTIDLEDDATLENGVESLSGSDSDVGDIYESHISKFTDQRVLDESKSERGESK